MMQQSAEEKMVNFAQGTRIVVAKSPYHSLASAEGGLSAIAYSG
jgi:hypothetical protein